MIVPIVVRSRIAIPLGTAPRRESVPATMVIRSIVTPTEPSTTIAGRRPVERRIVFQPLPTSSIERAPRIRTGCSRR